MAVITGTSGNDTLNGTSGADQISGLDGDDTLIGGAGADSLDGGNGTDTASYANATSGVIVDLYNGSTSSGDAAGDIFISIEKFIGSNYNDTFVASNNVEYFDGGLGTIDYINYSHSMTGITISFNVTASNYGAGVGGTADGDSFTNMEGVVGSNYDDIYIIGTNSGSWGIAEAANGGTDEVRTALSFISLVNTGANVELITYTGTGSFTAVGNASNNTITGGNGNDTFTGGAGADVFNGGNGTDTASYATATSGVIVDLYNGSTSTGDAAGDIFISIEKFIGSNGFVA